MAAPASDNPIADLVAKVGGIKLEKMRGRLYPLIAKLLAGMLAMSADNDPADDSPAGDRPAKTPESDIFTETTLLDDNSETPSPDDPVEMSESDSFVETSDAPTSSCYRAFHKRKSSAKFPASPGIWFVRECFTNPEFADIFITPHVNELRRVEKLARLPMSTPEEDIIWRSAAARVVWMSIDESSRRGGGAH
jgi:hypothetical protein